MRHRVNLFKLKNIIKTMSKLIIKGNRKYILRMFKHLKKEHPSVRHRISMKSK